ncbi:MAG: type II toxin-antitoxin system VapC family toxin [Candidatus Omnitrophica bacterium]|nr:type II toxin-antitoxin system VapC family toxin [Candidatus Omnitrophota bacterium]
MSKPSVYIETTVISYMTARPSRDLITAAHQQITMEWWENTLPYCDPFISPMVIEEVARGDKEAANLRLKKISGFPVLKITNEVRELADLYFTQTQIPEKARGDTYHLALATYHGMDFLVSWNFTHILAAPVKAMIQKINTYQGIQTPIICSPEELMEV